jgi:hypothetical protein
MEKVETLPQVETKVTVGVLTSFAIATILPFFLHIQLLTGPIINAMLIIATVILGLRWALALSIIPSIMALVGGLLLPFMAPVVPFIIVSNMIMVAGVNYFYQGDKNANNGFWKGVLAGALAKSFFLMLTGFAVLKYFHNPQAVKLAISAFGLIQFLTALAGAIIAFSFLKFTKKI